jgi:hypothetical protein
MNSVDIYKLQNWVTIWEGAALILNIDPSDVICIPSSIYDSPIYGIGEILPNPSDDSFYLEPAKIDFVYQKAIGAILNSGTDFSPALKIRGSSLNPERQWEADQSSEVKIDDLIEWAISKGFKSEFLGNLEMQKAEKQENSLFTPHHNADSDYYAIELEVAIKAHEAVVINGWKDGNKRNGFSDYLKAWVRQNYPSGSTAFVDRIAAVANPKKEIPTSKQ